MLIMSFHFPLLYLLKLTTLLQLMMVQVIQTYDQPTIASSAFKMSKIKKDQSSSSSLWTNLSPSPLFQMFDYYKHNNNAIYLLKDKRKRNSNNNKTIKKGRGTKKSEDEEEVIVSQTYIRWYNHNKTTPQSSLSSALTDAYFIPEGLTTRNNIRAKQQIPSSISRWWSKIRSIPSISSKLYYTNYNKKIKKKQDKVDNTQIIAQSSNSSSSTTLASLNNNLLRTSLISEIQNGNATFTRGGTTFTATTTINNNSTKTITGGSTFTTTNNPTNDTNSNINTNTNKNILWVPELYPNPINEPKKCNIDSLLLFDESSRDNTILSRKHDHGQKLYLCDPDSILSFTYLNRISSALLQSFTITTSNTNNHNHNHSHNHTTTTTTHDNIIPVKIAVAIVNKINLSSVLHSSKSYYNYEEEEDMINDAAQYFSRYLYDSWFVTDVNVTKQYNHQHNGILIFLSIEDHVCFISTGASITNILPWWRLDRIVSDMKPKLRRHNFGEAILTSIDDIKYAVTILGPPTMLDRLYDFIERFGIIICFCVFTFLFAIYGEYRDKIRRMQYVENMSNFLNEKEKLNALHLMHEYDISACPICLEPFPIIDDSSITIGQSPDSISTTTTTTSTTTATTNTTASIGNDGLPLKLLRCGHAFDQTCWKCWVYSGYGNPCKCPVCRQDIGGRPLLSQQRQQSGSSIFLNTITRQPNITRSTITTRFINRLAVASATATGTTNFFPTNTIYNNNDDNNNFFISTHGRLSSINSSNDNANASTTAIHYGTFDNNNTAMVVQNDDINNIIIANAT